MILYILLCNILFIPVIYSGSNTTLNTILNQGNGLNQTSILNKPQNDVPTQPKLMVSEGGSLSPDDTSLLLPKKNSIPPKHEELGTEKDKPVKRRNGVGDPLKNNSAVIQNSESNISASPPIIKNRKNDTVANKNEKPGIEKLLTENSKKIVINNTKLYNVNESKIDINGYNSSNTRSNKTEFPKKKLVLSYEALANMDDIPKSNIPAMKSSSNTIVNDQMPSPNADSKDVYSKNASKHPGMIMPAVITILVLPMFAVLGYMALRRGQEAWKNRHYKRMDFLLDGMYND